MLWGLCDLVLNGQDKLGWYHLFLGCKLPYTWPGGTKCVLLVYWPRKYGGASCHSSGFHVEWLSDTWPSQVNTAEGQCGYDDVYPTWLDMIAMAAVTPDNDCWLPVRFTESVMDHFAPFNQAACYLDPYLLLWPSRSIQVWKTLRSTNNSNMNLFISMAVRK